MAKFAETESRIFKNIFVCRNCKSRIRANNMKVIAGKIKCRKCDSKSFRPVRKK